MVKGKMLSRKNKPTNNYVMFAVLSVIAIGVVLAIVCVYMTRSNENLDIQVVPPKKIEPVSGPGVISKPDQAPFVSAAPIDANAQFDVGAERMGIGAIGDYWKNWGEWVEQKWKKWDEQNKKDLEEERQRDAKAKKAAEARKKPPSYYKAAEAECKKGIINKRTGTRYTNWYPNDKNTWARFQVANRVYGDYFDCDCTRDENFKCKYYCCNVALPKIK